MNDAQHTIWERVQAYPRLALGAYYVALLILGLFLVGDYGSYYDEPINMRLGEETYRYVVECLTGGDTPREEIFQGIAEQGPAYEFILHGLTELAGLTGPEDRRRAIFLRHVLTLITCWLGVVAFHLLLLRHYGTHLVALIGALLLVLSPRLFAHAFYNSKDTVLAALFVIGTLTLLRFVEKRSWQRGLVHGVMCALIIDVRVVGLILPLLTLAFLAAEWLRQESDRGDWRGRCRVPVGVFLGAVVVCTVLFWPQSWAHPWQHFSGVLTGLSEAQQLDNPSVRFRGEFVNVDELPWHYLITWMLITIPLGYLILFGIGVGLVVGDVRRRSLLAAENLRALLFLAILLLPLGAAMLLSPRLYDGWRHFYFVYPAFLVLALRPVHEVLRRPRWVSLGFVGLAVLLLPIAWSMRALHPYQNVYFNLLAQDPETRYELDYWGLSYREGLEFVLDRHPTGTVGVVVADFPGIVNSWLLDPADAQRLRLNPDPKEAQYFISHHRKPSHFRAWRDQQAPYSKQVHSVQAGGAEILGVYRLR